MRWMGISRSGFLYLIPSFCAWMRATGPHPLRARELTTPHPEGLTTRLVPVEVDLKQRIFDICSSLNNGHSPKGRLRQLCAAGSIGQRNTLIFQQRWSVEMKQRRRIYYSAAQRSEIWDR